MTTTKDKQTLSPPVEVAVSMWEIIPHHLDKLPDSWKLLVYTPCNPINKYKLEYVLSLRVLKEKYYFGEKLLSLSDPTEYFTEVQS